MPDFSLPQRCKWDVRFSGILSSLEWLVSYRRFGTTYWSLFQGPAVQEEVLDPWWWDRRCGTTYWSHFQGFSGTRRTAWPVMLGPTLRETYWSHFQGSNGTRRTAWPMMMGPTLRETYWSHVQGSNGPRRSNWPLMMGPTLRNNILVPFSRIQRSEWNCRAPDEGTDVAGQHIDPIFKDQAVRGELLDSWYGTDRLTETSVRKYHFTLRRITKQRRYTKLFLIFFLYSRFLASWLCSNKTQQDATVFRCLFTAKLLYMFRVSIAPIIRST